MSSTQNTACGLPTLTTDGEASSGPPPGCTMLQIDGLRILERLGQRDVAPAEARAPHIDGDAAGV